MALDCSSQVTSAILSIRTFLQENILCLPRAVQDEFVIALRSIDSTLHLVELNLQYFPEIILGERPKHDYLVNAIHEFR